MSKFKQGDRVRYIGEGHYVTGGIERGDLLDVLGDSIIENATNVQVTTDYIVYNNELELVSESDPTTAFLTELQDLLRKYDAFISNGKTYDGKDLIHISIGTDDVFYVDDGTPLVVTPDNIFDYDMS